MHTKWYDRRNYQCNVDISLTAIDVMVWISNYFTMLHLLKEALIARFMGPTWGPSGAERTQVGPMLAPWSLLSGRLCNSYALFHISAEKEILQDIMKDWLSLPYTYQCMSVHFILQIYFKYQFYSKYKFWVRQNESYLFLLCTNVYW